MDDRNLYGITTFLADGTRVSFEFHARQAPRRVYPKYGRPYYSTTWREYDAKPRLYVSTPGETLLDNLVNRTSRPHTVWAAYLKDAMRQLELPGTIRWSQKAGCSCPCSPGFILTDGPDKLVDYARYDVWATIYGAPTVEDTFERARRAASVLADPTLSPEMLATPVG